MLDAISRFDSTRKKVKKNLFTCAENCMKYIFMPDNVICQSKYIQI